MIFQLCSTAKAFESWPEYRGLAAAEAEGLDDPRLIDAEYISDFVSYQKPLSWEAKLWRRQQGFDFSVGSLGGKEFLLDQRLLLTAPFTERLTFRLIWFNDQELEDDFSTQKMEIAYRVGASWGVAGYGSLAFHKEENDVGAALWRRVGLSEARVYFSLLDFQRNERNRETDRWGKHSEPKAYGLIMRRSIESELGPSWWSEFSVRHEPRAKWNFPDVERRYEYQRTAAHVKVHRELADGRARSTRLAWDDKSESETFFAPASPSENQVRRQRIWLQAEQTIPQGKVDLRVGLNHFWRRYVGLGRDVVYRDWLPTLWLDRENWQFGYDAAFRWTSFSGDWLDAKTEHDDINHRLNVLYRWLFADQGELAFLFTFDLDRFGTEETWQGGSSRLQWFF
ncbi:MAG: hypothetical protein AB7N80_04230 [Bdellovibrionales bacterium]